MEGRKSWDEADHVLLILSSDSSRESPQSSGFSWQANLVPPVENVEDTGGDSVTGQAMSRRGECDIEPPVSTHICPSQGHVGCSHSPLQALTQFIWSKSVWSDQPISSCLSASVFAVVWHDTTCVRSYLLCRAAVYISGCLISNKIAAPTEWPQNFNLNKVGKPLVANESFLNGLLGLS